MAQPPKPRVSTLDHLVLTVADLDTTCRFYADVLGIPAIPFTVADGSTRWALKVGLQKINLHQAGAEFDPKAAKPTPGSADLCFLSEAPVQQWQTHLADLGIPIEDGPVPRTGAQGPILSLYVRDPDKNLIEVGTLP